VQGGKKAEQGAAGLRVFDFVQIIQNDAVGAGWAKRAQRQIKALGCLLGRGIAEVQDGPIRAMRVRCEPGNGCFSATRAGWDLKIKELFGLNPSEVK
jgi:hypothetical protein